MRMKIRTVIATLAVIAVTGLALSIAPKTFNKTTEAAPKIPAKVKRALKKVMNKYYPGSSVKYSNVSYLGRRVGHRYTFGIDTVDHANPAPVVSIFCKKGRIYWIIAFEYNKEWGYYTSRFNGGLRNL